MRWTDVYFAKGGPVAAPQQTALIMGAAWMAVAHWPDTTVAQTLGMNALDPLGVLNTLDWRGVPIPPEIASL